MPVQNPRESFPGKSLGLPPSGRGALATWQSRIAALIIDWAASMAVAGGLFGTAVLTGNDWRRFMILAIFFVESTLLSALAGGSFGQLVSKVGIARLDHRPLGFARAVVRAALVSLVIPALIVGPERRGLHDVLVGTVVIKRR
jgi:uncharacterized RDD family membrane protein YckC